MATFIYPHQTVPSSNTQVNNSQYSSLITAPLFENTKNSFIRDYQDSKDDLIRTLDILINSIFDGKINNIAIALIEYYSIELRNNYNKLNARFINLQNSPGDKSKKEELLELESFRKIIMDTNNGDYFDHEKVCDYIVNLYLIKGTLKSYLSAVSDFKDHIKNISNQEE